MFTGLVESTGEIVRRADQHLQIRPHRELANLQHGESIAVNGCCLTFERQLAGNILEFFTLQETLKRTNLSTVSMVNLERALRVGDRLGGHLVSGHIDATGELLGLKFGLAFADLTHRAEPDFPRLASKHSLQALRHRSVIDIAVVAHRKVPLTVGTALLTLDRQLGSKF